MSFLVSCRLASGSSLNSLIASYSSFCALSIPPSPATCSNSALTNSRRSFSRAALGCGGAIMPGGGAPGMTPTTPGCWGLGWPPAWTTTFAPGPPPPPGPGGPDGSPPGPLAFGVDATIDAGTPDPGCIEPFRWACASAGCGCGCGCECACAWGCDANGWAGNALGASCW